MKFRKKKFMNRKNNFYLALQMRLHQRTGSKGRFLRHKKCQQLTQSIRTKNLIFFRAITSPCNKTANTMKWKIK